MDFFNMTSCEINELYKSGKLDFSSLSREELDAIFETETNELYRNKNHSLTVLNECSLVLSKYLENEDPDYARFVAKTITMDDIQNIIETANERKKIKAKEESTAKHIPVRRTLAIMIAAALLVTVLSVTCVALFDPFSELGITIREIFNMKPNETHKTRDIDLSVSDEIIYYDSYEELVEAVGFEILWFDEEATGYEVEKISTFKIDGVNTINIVINATDSNQLIYNINYGENAHKKYGQGKWNDLDTKKLNGYDIYFTTKETGSQAVFFNNELIYKILSSNVSVLEDFLININ